MTLNRTIVGWKDVSPFQVGDVLYTLNRTIVGWKDGIAARGGEIIAPLNRTIVGWKVYGDRNVWVYVML